uniref:Uncharacterized protein n=1 Tax=Micrurus spixii TaxID=129469 RepID=A0A2D4M9K6_9SAUR
MLPQLCFFPPHCLTFWNADLGTGIAHYKGLPVTNKTQFHTFGYCLSPNDFSSASFSHSFIFINIHSGTRIIGKKAYSVCIYILWRGMNCKRISRHIMGNIKSKEFFSTIVSSNGY